MNLNLLDTLVSQLDSSPTPYHVVETAKQVLLTIGFEELQEDSDWQLSKGGRYFVARRDSSLIAFNYGDGDFVQSGVRIIGAHTDSPVLKVKPKPEKCVEGYQQLGVEVYGGALFAPWFDRDLSLAGRVSVGDDNGINHYLVDFKRAIGIVPSLAIHLDRQANEGRAINPQEHMRPILGQQLEGGSDFNLLDLLKEEIWQSHKVKIEQHQVVDYDLCFYDVQGAGKVGLREEFLASARLDNLLSCFVGLNALVESLAQPNNLPSVLALFDHEEVGSQSDVGARSNFLMAVLERMMPDKEICYKAARKSLILSVDNAHGVHPNFRAKHDESHGPILNRGPVMKYDANQGYATSAPSAVFLKGLAQRAAVPLQAFVMRADMRCGSTIGPMSAASSGISTVDLGVSTFAMHSVRELAGTKDIEHLNAILLQFLETRSLSL